MIAAAGLNRFRFSDPSAQYRLISSCRGFWYELTPFQCFTPRCLTRTALKDSVALQFPHLGRAVTEIAGQHQLVVLAQKGGIQGQGLFEIRESKRETRQIAAQAKMTFIVSPANEIFY
jgi:hypothetical protein